MLKSLIIWLLLFVAILVVDKGFSSEIDPYALQLIIYAGINIILAVSLNLVNGFTGQFSMGHAGFMAVGAYSSACITIWANSRWGLADGSVVTSGVFLVALLSGGLAASLAGYLVGIPTLRLKGDYLAIVTLGLGEIIRVILLNLSIVGGARGLAEIPGLSSLSWIYGFGLVTVFCIWRILQSAHGRALISVREDEVAAQASGVDTTTAKVRAFVIGSFFAGIAGGLFAHQLSYITPSVFDFNKSIEVIIMVVLGGMGSISGSIVAAIFVTALPELLRPMQALTGGVDLRMVIYSLCLILLMLTRPRGLFGNKEIFEFLPFSIKKILGLGGERK